MSVTVFMICNTAGEKENSPMACFDKQCHMQGRSQDFISTEAKG